MVDDPGDGPPSDEIAGIYLGIAAASTGHSPSSIRAALAMSVVLLGERQGLTGPDLLDWIDTIASTARRAAQAAPGERPPAN